MRITKFFDRMQEKLDENSHKGNGWLDCSQQHLLTRIRQETKELKEAIESGADPETVEREAADVANFCFMIADNYRDRYQRKEDKSDG